MTRKLKPDRGIQGLIPAIVSVVIFIFSLIVFGLHPALRVLAVIMFLYATIFGFWSFYKTDNPYFLVSGFYLISFGFVLLFANFEVHLGEATTEFRLSLLFVYFFMIWLIYIVVRKKLKWRGREIMELAAWDIESGSGTYTERPMPVTKIDFSKYDIIDFANYLKKNLICLAYQEENRVLLLPVKMGDEMDFLLNPSFDYVSKTWISFDFEGNVSVHISRKDYLDYREDFQFDQLCDSLGKLMVMFAEFYVTGNKVRIIDRLDSVKIGYFS